MNKYWTFYVFRIDEFRAWKKTLPINDRAKIDLFVSRLELIRNWPKKLVKPVTGYRKIFELRIHGKNIIYRPLGCYGPRAEEFTILFPAAIERGDKFEPRDAPKRAQERQPLAFQNRGFLSEYEYD